METDWRFVLHSAYLFKLFNDINNIIQILLYHNSISLYTAKLNKIFKVFMNFCFPPNRNPCTYTFL